MEQNKEWVPGMDMGFEVGQTVYFHGTEYEITFVDSISIFDNCNAKNKLTDKYIRFGKDGRYLSSDNHPSVFFKPQTFDISRPEWEPKPGEWCWFWNISGYSFLGKFLKIYKDKYVSTSSDRWENCAPFKGELPEHLKEK